MSDLSPLRRYEVREDDLALWRYMNLRKFKSLMKSKSLYFPPSSTFNDELEGHITNYDHRAQDAQLSRFGISTSQRQIAEQARKAIADSNQMPTVISCWTKNTDGPECMWKEYGGSIEKSVAIETTVGRLRGCLGSEFLIIPITYLDFEKDSIPGGHSLLPFFFKRLKYSQEREVRIIGDMEMGKRIGSHRTVQVDLKLLLGKIVVSPKASRFFRNCVERITRKHAPSVPVELS